MTLIGRKEILKEISKSIEEKEPAVVVKGPGGSGKTALLQRVTAHLKQKQFAFIITEGETHPELVLEKIFLKAKKKGIPGAEKMHDGTGQGLREKILWFVEHYLEKEKIMLVFEDFETNLNLDGKFKSERLKEFLMYLKDSLKEKETLLFFTTETDIPGFNSVTLPPFSDEEFKKLLTHHKALNQLNQKSREKLQFDMGTNPRGLQLLDHIAYQEFGEKKFQWDTLKKKIPNLAERILYKESEEADFSPLVLEKIFKGLTPSQQQLLKGLSIFNGTVGKAALEALGLKATNKDRKTLADLFLMEYTAQKDLHRVHRLTTRFVLGNMSEAEKKQLHLRAADYFQSLKDETKERDIENEIETRKHYLEAEEWDKAADMSLELDQYLTARGFPQLAFDLLKEIEDREYNRDNQIRLYQRLGLFYGLFGQLDNVITQNEKLVDIYEEMEERSAAARCLGQMGMAYEKKRKFDDSLREFDKAREIFEEIGDSSAAAFILLEMGKIHQKRGKYDEALAQYQKALAHSQRGKDRKGESGSLQQMAQVHEEQGKFDDALKFYRQSQKVKEEIGDKKEIAAGLHQIGNIYFLKGKFDTALNFYQQSLALREKTKNLNGAAYSLGQIGMILHRKGQKDEALKHYKSSRELFEKVQDEKGLSSALHQLGRIYQEQGEKDQALEHYKKSLEIREKSADMPGMALGYGQLGLLYFEREEYEESMRSSTKSFVLFARMNPNAPGAQLARKNMLKVRDKLPKETFEEILMEFNIQPEKPKEEKES